jgi:hypothetical protein
VEAVELFERAGNKISPQDCRENALRFSPERFRRELREYIDRQLDLFYGKTQERHFPFGNRQIVK